MSKEFKVIIKPDAFVRMITHVLRFGNEALEESVEVMGVCVGKIDDTDNKIHLLNIIPIQHGLPVSTGFTKEDIELFSQLNKEYQEKEMMIVGWYLSRPGWGLEFTDITIQNHRFFQTEKNLHGFVIIFDHTMMGMENDFGFKIFTLKEHKISNDFYELPYEVEVPSSLNVYKWVQKFVEDSQRLTPILIKELKEQPLKELQEIPLSEEHLLVEGIKDYSDQIDLAISGFRNGILKLDEHIGKTYESQLNSWIGDMTQGTLKGMEFVGGSLNQLKNTVSDGLKDVQNFFNTTFTEISSLFKKNITEYINKRVQEQNELKNEISAVLNRITEESMNKMDEKIRESLKPLEENIEAMLTTIENTNNLSSKLANITGEINILTSKVEEDLTNLKKNIPERIEDILSPIKAQIDEKFEILDSELNPTKESYSEIRPLLEKLQKIITEFKNLT
ncbi:MAG: hypothetical protein ACXAEX_17410 [Promethearchaeota archaeon]|jgi:hypothetical protein